MISHTKLTVSDARFQGHGQDLVAGTCVTCQLSCVSTVSVTLTQLTDCHSQKVPESNPETYIEQEAASSFSGPGCS